jgi:hypothetical protein
MMSVSDIRELAFSWWKRGFAELRTEEDFRVLLDEMQGLGILREKAGEYALRAINPSALTKSDPFGLRRSDPEQEQGMDVQ